MLTSLSTANTAGIRSGRSAKLTSSIPAGRDRVDLRQVEHHVPFPADLAKPPTLGEPDRLDVVRADPAPDLLVGASPSVPADRLEQRASDTAPPRFRPHPRRAVHRAGQRRGAPDGKTDRLTVQVREPPVALAVLLEAVPQLVDAQPQAFDLAQDLSPRLDLFVAPRGRDPNRHAAPMLAEWPRRSQRTRSSSSRSTRSRTAATASPG
jgi:hypothetical protein